MQTGWLTKAIRVSVFAAIVVATQTAACRAENRLAFVVGVNAYSKLGEAAQLKHAVNDADAVGATLGNIGFTVTKITGDATLSTVLSRFGQFVSTIERGDTVLFYFAGHGIALDDGTYLLPSDVPALGPTDQMLAKRSALSEHEISDGIRGSGARAIIIILDACRDNPFPRKGTRALGSATRGLARLTTTEGVFTLYSAREGQTAMDTLSDSDPDPNSVFTRTLMKELRTPGLSLSDVGERVRDEVAALAHSVGHDQVPAVSNDLIGARNLVLVGSVSQPKPPEEHPTSSPRDQPFCARGGDYDKIIQTSGVDALRGYVQQCGQSGAYAQQAKQEFESRLFLASSECIRRATGCQFDGCLRIYDADMPDGSRASTLRDQAAQQSASRAMCQAQALATPDPARDIAARNVAPDLAIPPAWCRPGARLKPTESLICSDARLSRLDARLNTIYADRLQALTGARRVVLASGENLWIADRERRCGTLSSNAMTSCLVDSMERRIAEIASDGAPAAEEPRVPPPAWCRQANHLKPTEELICADGQLARLDAQLNQHFTARLQATVGTGRSRLTSAERDWLIGRDGRCGALPRSAMKDCLVNAMHARIGALEN